MRYNCCSSCQYYREEYKTPELRLPRHCVHPEVSEMFGVNAGGFISSIDIFHCDYYFQYDSFCGDVLIKLKKGGIISYVVPNVRKKLHIYQLTDNSQNIKTIYSNEQKHKSRHMEKNSKGSHCSPFGTDGCPF